MQPASAWRLELASKVLEVYAANSKVAAVEVGGSVGRGEADRAVVVKHLDFNMFWRWEVALERDDLFAFYGRIGWVISQMLPVIAGLNHVEYPQHRWKDWTPLFSSLEQLTAHYPYSPEHLAQRCQSVFQVEPRQAIPILKALVEETFRLVDTRLPGFDTAPARAMFAAPHPAWDSPVNFLPNP